MEKVTLKNITNSTVQAVIPELAQEYNNTISYNNGDYCTYRGTLYKCIQSCSSTTNSVTVNSTGASAALSSIYFKAIKVTDEINTISYASDTNDLAQITACARVNDLLFDDTNNTIDSNFIIDISNNITQGDYDSLVSSGAVHNAIENIKNTYTPQQQVTIDFEQSIADSAKTFQKNEIVWYKNQLYKFNETVNLSSWDSTKVEPITINTLITEGWSDKNLNDINSSANAQIVGKLFEKADFEQNALLINKVYPVYDTSISKYTGVELTPTTGYGLFGYTDNNKIIVYGTVTNTRRLILFNNESKTGTTSSDFITILTPGIYRFHIKYTGFYVPTSSEFDGLKYTYSNFGSNEVKIKDNDLIEFTDNVMIGLGIYTGKNYGTIDNPTVIEISAEKLISNSDKINFYKKQVLKAPGTKSFSGFDHQGFPDVEYINNNLVICSRVSASHYTPPDIRNNEWGGLEIDTVDNSGQISFKKLITRENFQQIDKQILGEVRGGHISNTKYGIFLACWTTYDWNKHECIIARLNTSYSVQSDYHKLSWSSPLPSNISFTQKPLITPSGHLIICGYRSNNVYICRSNQSLEDTTFANLTFSLHKVNQSVLNEEVDGDEEVEGNIAGNECSLCYNNYNNKLYMMIRNDEKNTSSEDKRGTIIISTDNLEGNDGWQIEFRYFKNITGADTYIHMPQLIPYQNNKYLIFCGANYRGASKRNFVIGAINISKELSDSNAKGFPTYIYRLDDTLHYGGYGGIVSRGNNEYDVAYYSEGYLPDGKSGTLATGHEYEKFNITNKLITNNYKYVGNIPITTGVYYRRINLKELLPQIFNEQNDNIIVDSTLSIGGAAADAKATGDAVSVLLDLAAPTKYSEAIVWQAGRYSSTTGVKQTTPSGSPRYRTASKLPSSISVIKAPSGYTLALYAWEGSTFVGTLRVDGTFKTVVESQSATAFTDSIILKKYQVAYPAYSFALTIKHGSNEAIVENDLVNVDFREDITSDIPDEIDDLEDGVNNAFKTATGSRRLFWKPRSIHFTTGEDLTPSAGEYTRYRTPFYLPEHVLRIVSSDLEFLVYAWDEEDGIFTGVLNNSGEVAPYTSDGPAPKWLSVVNLESLRKSHPGYKWMLVTRNKADTSAEITQTQLDAAKAIIRINEIEEEFASVGIFERIGFAGASWECGYTWVDFDNDGTYEDSESFLAYSNSWPACMCRKNGNTCVNSSSSGASIKQWYEYSGNSPRGMKELISQDACDIYFLSLSGSNNSKSFTTSTVGTIADITGYNDYHDYPETFYGYYGKTIERLKAHAPNALIVIFSGPSDYDVHDTSTSAQVRKACEAATVEVAEHYGLPYIEIREDRFYDYYATHLSKSHPVPITYSGAARMYERLFSKAAVKYYDYFKYWPVERITVPEVES